MNGIWIVLVYICFACQGVQSKLPVSECTIIKDPAPLPAVGVISANPARALLIAEKHFDTYYNHTNFRGFQVYKGTYKGVPIFAANTGLGGPAAAFLVEELIAHEVQVIIRLGTNDYNVTDLDLNNVYLVESVRGLYGLMRDYGYPADSWGTPIASDSALIQLLNQTAQRMPNITAVLSKGYTIDAFYAFFDPPNVAENPNQVDEYITQYQQDGCNVRDMESASVLLVGQMRGIQTAAVLQAVIKSGNHHEDVGTIGIPLVLETLRILGEKYMSN